MGKARIPKETFLLLNIVSFIKMVYSKPLVMLQLYRVQFSEVLQPQKGITTLSTARKIVGICSRDPVEKK